MDSLVHARNIRKRRRANKGTESFSTWKSRWKQGVETQFMPWLSWQVPTWYWNVWGLKHLIMAVTCHVTTQEGFQRTGKYRNIEQDQERWRAAWQHTHLPRKCQSSVTVFFYLTPPKWASSLEVERREWPLTFDVRDWLRQLIKRCRVWGFMFVSDVLGLNLNPVIPLQPVYSILILGLLILLDIYCIKT